MTFVEFVGFLLKNGHKPCLFRVRAENASAIEALGFENDLDDLIDVFRPKLAESLSNIAFFGITSQEYRNKMPNAPEPFAIWCVAELEESRARRWKIVFDRKTKRKKFPMHSNYIAENDTTFEEVAGSLLRHVKERNFQAFGIAPLDAVAFAFLSRHLPIRPVN